MDAFVDAIRLEKPGFVHVRAHKRGAGGNGLVPPGAGEERFFTGWVL